MSIKSGYYQTFGNQFTLLEEYNNSYWNGLDLALYIGGIYIDDPVAVAYSVVESQVPYYGYGSYVPDRIHSGQRLIQGQFTINYKQDSYIFAVLRNIGKEISTEPVAELPEGGVPDPGFDSAADPSSVGATQIERARIASLRRKSQYNQVLGIYEEARQNTSWTSIDKPLFHSDGPINIELRFGYLLSDAPVLRMASGKQQWLRGHVYRPASPEQPGTGIRFLNCKINGYQKQMSDLGPPITETYSFIGSHIEPISMFEETGFGGPDALVEPKLIL